MKKSLFIAGLMILKLGLAYADNPVIDQDWNVNSPIPEGSPVGMTVYQTFSGLPADPISSVSVDLNISGGYNGVLVGYLVLQDANGNTATEYLLNQMGVTGANPFGSSGAGMNVTLTDAGTVNGSIHDAAGVPTGMWLSDSPNTLNGTFGGLTANGTWTLYLAAPTGGGGTGTLVSWGLDVTTTVVPEPGTNAMLALGGLAVMGGWMFQRRKTAGLSAK